MVGGLLTQNSSSYHYIYCRFSHFPSFFGLRLSVSLAFGLFEDRRRRPLASGCRMTWRRTSDEHDDKEKTLYTGNKTTSKIIWPQHPLIWNNFYFIIIYLMFNFLGLARARVCTALKIHQTNAIIFMQFRYNCVSDAFRIVLAAQNNISIKPMMPTNGCSRVKWLRSARMLMLCPVNDNVRVPFFGRKRAKLPAASVAECDLPIKTANLCIEWWRCGHWPTIKLFVFSLVFGVTAYTH